MQNITIKGGESLSSAISLWGTKFFALKIPDEFTGSSITFQGGDVDFDMKNIYNAQGLEVSAAVVAGTMCVLDSIALSLAPFRCMKVRSGTSASPTLQLGTTSSSVVIDFGDDKTLTLTSGVKGTRGDDLAVMFEMNDEDTLAVSNPDGAILLVKLASTTAAKNTAALIEDGIQALSVVGGIDVSALTVEASAEYTAAPPVGTKASSVVDFGDDKTLTFTYGLGGTQGNGVPIRVENNDEDTLSVTNPAETDEILIKLATTTDTKNADTAIETAVQTLAAAGGYDLTGMTVTGSTEYGEAPPAGTKSVTNITYLDNEENSLGTLTLTAGAVGADGRDVMYYLIYQLMEANDSDALSVTWFDYVGNSMPLPDYPSLHIKLANLTPSNNSAAAIQAAIEALMVTSPLTDEGVYGGVYADLQPYITGMTVAGDTVWNASPPITTYHTVSRDSASFVLGTMPILNPLNGTTSGGADVGDEAGDFAGGEDPVIGVIIKE